MKFLDKKEQVFDIQLTQHGKRLLSKGVFRPEYYAFFDDDIIYDYNWAGQDETQNEAEGRIFEVSRLEPQYNFSGVETKLKEQNVINSQAAQNESDREVPFGPLNTADPFSNFIPAWDIQFLNGKIESFEKMFKAESLQLKIPQLEVILHHDLKISHTDAVFDEGDFLDPNGMTPGDDHTGFIFPDGTYHFLDATKGDMFLKLREHNTEFLDDNFEIEVYKINTDEELEKLYFMNDQQANIKDGILLDEHHYADITDFGPHYVEYYFDLLTDKQITNEIYCKALQENVLEDIYSDKQIFDCDEIEQVKNFSDIYKISKEIDEEPC
tara:strand:+ start:49482 stop:50456 length:975 start_codon:yes stop_codon:yes gene_type:complete